MALTYNKGFDIRSASSKIPGSPVPGLNPGAQGYGVPSDFTRDYKAAGRRYNQVQPNTGSSGYHTMGGSSGGSSFGAAPVNPLSKYEDQAYYGNMGNAYDAMQITQDRAAADREAALGELRGAKTSALSDYSQVGGDMITENARNQMYNEGREVAESERGSMLRQLQRSSGGMPSGASMEAAGQIDQAKMGTLANLKRKIGTEASEKNWTSRFQMAGATSAIKTGTADRLAEVLGNTIAAVPKYENPVKSMEAAQQQQATATAQNAPKYTATNDFGRRGNEMNTDFAKRDPEGFAAWSAAGMPRYGTSRGTSTSRFSAA